MSATLSPPSTHQHPGAGGRPGTRSKWRRPGWYRAGLWTLIGACFFFGFVTGLRALGGNSPTIDGDAITIVVLIGTPFFFLYGLGTFDYWFYWASGKPTLPEDHSS